MRLFYLMKARDKKSPQFEHLDKDIVLKKMGARIKALRIKHGYTSYEYFAYDHNISCAQFGRYEKGQDLRVSSLIKIVNAFNISLQEFFEQGFD